MKASFETNFKMLLPLPAHVIFQIVHIYLYPSHTGLSFRKNETYEQIYDALIQNISRYSLHVVLVILLTIIKEKSLKNEKKWFTYYGLSFISWRILLTRYVDSGITLCMPLPVDGQQKAVLKRK